MARRTFNLPRAPSPAVPGRPPRPMRNGTPDSEPSRPGSRGEDGATRSILRTSLSSSSSERPDLAAS